MDVGEGLVGFVVMDRAVLFMVVMVLALDVHEFVGQRSASVGLRQAALHGKAIQGNAQQQKEVDKPAHEKSRRVRRL